MSRTSNRGPRADIALLRKLKADPNFSPASLLTSGPNILEKVNKLKGFVENQRGKLGASAAKTEWLLAYQQLQGEQDDAERELTGCLQQLSDHSGADQLREVAEVALVTLYDDAESGRVQRQHLRSQIKDLSSVHNSLKAYGKSSDFSKEATALKTEMSATARELETTLASLTEQAAALATDLREFWPSALAAGQGGADSGLASSSTASASCLVSESVSPLPGYSRSDDCEELERMMSRYPLASPDIKGRIREVFAALQEKALERFETWRVESEQAARDLAAVVAASASSSATSSSRTQHHTLRSKLPHNTRGSNFVSKPPGPAATATATATATAAATAAGARALPGRGKTVATGRAEGPAGGGGAPGPPSTSGRDLSASSCIPQLVTATTAAAGRCSGLDDGSKVTGAVDGASVYDDDAAASVGSGKDGGEGASTAAGTGVAGGGGGSADGGCVSWAFAGYGGWSAEEHSAFVRHRDRLMRECSQGPKSLSREGLMTRIATLLPGGRTTAQLLAHDDWTTASRLLGRKRRDLAEAWDRERRQFLEDSANFLQESETLFLVQAEEAADRLAAELQRVRARDDLEDLRAEKAREEEVAVAEKAVREAAEAEARLQAEARERRERAVKKEMVAAYRAELERQQAEQQAAAAEADRLAALESEQQAVYNRERVEIRHAEYVTRQEQVKERQAALEAEIVAREARLDRLRALVAPEVESDPERVLAPTAASAAVDPNKGVGGAFHPVNGFTTDQVVKDQRFKVMEALAVLGLHETTYGRQAIAAARPAKPTRPDNFTSAQREAITHQ